MESVKLTGKTVIVTGANTGIGLETALALARRGPKLILACRNAERGERARQAIVTETKNENVVVKILDLSSLKSIKAFADDFNASESRLDILVNNAGVSTIERKQTEDGFEMMFGTNHLGHFYLTCLLLEKLKASAPSRIVVVASMGHKLQGKLDMENLQLSHGWSGLKGYNRSKTANILFAVHLAKLLEGTGVTTYSLHPGVIDTEITRDMKTKGGCYGCVLSCITCCCCCIYSSPTDGAQTTLYCCLEPSIATHSGRYYSGCKEEKAESYARNPDLAEKLWQLSASLCRISPDPFALAASSIPAAASESSQPQAATFSVSVAERGDDQAAIDDD